MSGHRLFLSIPANLPRVQFRILKQILEVSLLNLLYPILRYVVAHHLICSWDYSLWIIALGKVLGTLYRLSLYPGLRAQTEVAIQRYLSPWHCPYPSLAAMAPPYRRFRPLTVH